MKLINIIKEEVMGDISSDIRRRIDMNSMDNLFYNSLDDTSDDFLNPNAILYNCSLFTFKKFVIDDMLVAMSEEMEDGYRIIFGYSDDEGQNDDIYHETVRKPLMEFYATKLDKRYIELRSEIGV